MYFYSVNLLNTGSLLTGTTKTWIGINDKPIELEHKDGIIGKDLIPLYEFNVGNTFDIIPADTILDLNLNSYAMQCASNGDVLIMCSNNTGYTRMLSDYTYEYIEYVNVPEFTSHIGSNAIVRHYVTDIDGTFCLALSTSYTLFLFQSIDGKNWTFLTSISDSRAVSLIAKINDEYFVATGYTLYYGPTLSSLTESSSIPSISDCAYDNKAIYIYQYSSNRVYRYDCASKTYSQFFTEYSDYKIAGGFSIDGYAIFPAYRNSDKASTNFVFHNGEIKTTFTLPIMKVNTGLSTSRMVQYCGKIGNTYVLFGESDSASGGIATSIAHTTDFTTFSPDRYISMQSSYNCTNHRAATFNNSIVIPGTTFYRSEVTTNNQTFAMVSMLSYRPGKGTRFVISGVTYTYDDSYKANSIYCNTNNVTRLDVIIKTTDNQTFVLTVTPHNTEAKFYVPPNASKQCTMATSWYENSIGIGFTGPFTMNRVINYTLYYEMP